MLKKFLLIIILPFLTGGLLHANSISIFGGSFDYDDDNTTSLFGLNYHLTDNDFSILGVLDLNPVVGAFVSGDSATMIYSGFETNIGSEKLYFNISSSAGVYSNGDGKDLGNAIQFKSEVNLFYSLSNKTQIGLGSHHISNAGLDSVNPGTNNFYLIFNRNF